MEGEGFRTIERRDFLAPDELKEWQRADKMELAASVMDRENMMTGEKKALAFVTVALSKKGTRIGHIDIPLEAVDELASQLLRVKDAAALLVATEGSKPN
jgi:hypothetical protein